MKRNGNRRYGCEVLEARLVLSTPTITVQVETSTPAAHIKGFRSVNDLSARPSAAARAIIAAHASSRSAGTSATSNALASTAAGGSGAALQALVSEPVVGRTFEGVDRNASNTLVADSDGDVSVEHVVQVTENRFRVSAKYGTTLEDRSLQSFFTSRAGITPTGKAYNPRVLYDGRWYIVATDNAGGDNNFLVAVSKTNDPTGAWSGFKIDSDSGTGRRYADFPQIATGNYMSQGQELVIAANMFDIAGGVDNGNEVNILVLPIEDLTATTPTVARRTLIENS